MSLQPDALGSSLMHWGPLTCCYSQCGPGTLASLGPCEKCSFSAPLPGLWNRSDHGGLGTRRVEGCCSNPSFGSGRPPVTGVSPKGSRLLTLAWESHNWGTDNLVSRLPPDWDPGSSSQHPATFTLWGHWEPQRVKGTSISLTEHRLCA